ncbi:hypothetical protein ZIOFF_033762 [Zingiber officinale]|uniref:Uncharacterized protein n=1 Tax=Zingiber officinale TaxID=94328 RepID=A0A8J5L746_ZINOF|nr:hypothetical protein ZIOFF_033762 [Zingiber officinale]
MRQSIYYGALLEATGEQRPLPFPFRAARDDDPQATAGGAVLPRKPEVLSLVSSPRKRGAIFRLFFIFLPISLSLARAIRMVAVTSLRPDRCVGGEFLSGLIFQSDLSGLSIGKQVQTGLIRIFPIAYLLFIASLVKEVVW